MAYEVEKHGSMTVWTSRPDRPGDRISIWPSGRKMTLTHVDDTNHTVDGIYEPVWRWRLRQAVSWMSDCLRWLAGRI